MSDPAQVARVRHVIETLGFCAPLLITGDDEIIDGDARKEAAEQLGVHSVPCIATGVSWMVSFRRRLLALLRAAPETHLGLAEVVRMAAQKGLAATPAGQLAHRISQSAPLQ